MSEEYIYENVLVMTLNFCIFEEKNLNLLLKMLFNLECSYTLNINKLNVDTNNTFVSNIFVCPNEAEFR